MVVLKNYRKCNNGAFPRDEIESGEFRDDFWNLFPADSLTLLSPVHGRFKRSQTDDAAGLWCVAGKCRLFVDRRFSVDWRVAEVTQRNAGCQPATRHAGWQPAVRFVYVILHISLSLHIQHP